jgi:hypothetical protein
MNWELGNNVLCKRIAYLPKADLMQHFVNILSRLKTPRFMKTFSCLCFLITENEIKSVLPVD